MERTAEVRWFLEGTPPGTLVDWFADLGAQPRERADRYLCLLETDALGVKLRGGADSLELKLRKQDHGEREFLDGVAGRVEEWQKWSFGVTGNGPSAQGLGLSFDVWLEVTKVRRLATYGPPGWKPAPAEQRRGDGCGIELTDLRVRGRDWFTLGFEAFGSEDAILESLGLAAGAFFGEVELPHGLGAEASCGYPGWLRRAAPLPGA